MRPTISETIDAPEKASQSLLARVDVCLASSLLYLKHRGGPQTSAMARGEVCHDFFEQATNMLIEQGEPNMPPEVGKDLMQAVVDERTDLALPAYEQDACRIIGWNWAAGTVLDLESIVCVESMLELEVAGWTVRGRIDRAEIANGQGWVRDLKTGLGIPSQETFEARFQTPFYALLLAEGHFEDEDTPVGKGLDGFHTIEEYPRWRSAEGGLVSRSAFLDRGQIHDFRRTVEGHLAKLEGALATGEWPATPGSWCSTCPMAGACPIPAAERDARAIATEGDAAEAAERVLTLGPELAELNKGVKGWVDENGELHVGDYVFGFTYSESERADKDAIKEFITEHGGEPADFFKASPSTRFGKSKVKT